MGEGMTFLEAISAGVKRCADPQPKRAKRNREGSYKPHTITMMEYWERWKDEIEAREDKDAIIEVFRVEYERRGKKTL